jgi:hypothetical protein
MTFFYSNQLHEAKESKSLFIYLMRLLTFIGLMSAEARELIEDPEAEVVVEETTRDIRKQCIVDNSLTIVVQDLLGDDHTERDPSLIADQETSRKEDASVVEREVTLKETVLRAEAVAVEDQDLLHNTRTRDTIAEDEEAEATHQQVVEEASMTREEEVQVAEV